MRKLKITHDWLDEHGACQFHRALFREVFPRGVTFTDEQEWNFLRVAKACEHSDENQIGVTVPEWGDTASSPGRPHKGLHVYWLVCVLYRMTEEGMPDNLLEGYDWTGRDDEWHLAGILAEAVAACMTRGRR
jgi:hypothetical protein